MRVFSQVLVSCWEEGATTNGFAMGVRRQSPRTHLHFLTYRNPKHLSSVLAKPEVLGLIWHAHSGEVRARIHRVLKDSGKPSVCVMHHEPDPVSPVLSLDKEMAGRQAVDHFVEQGYDHVAMCRRGEPWEEPYLAAFEQRAESLGREVFSAAIGRGGNGMMSRMDNVMAWLATVPKSVGLLIPDTASAAFVVNACGQAGHRVPREVGVLSLGDDPTWFSMHAPSISSVRLGMEALGFRASELLHHMAGGGEPPEAREVVSSVNVVTRRSTEHEAVEDPLVIAALDYMHSTHPANLDLRDLFEVLPASRRTIERHFKQTLGSTPSRELMRVRMRAVADLLTRTTMPLVEIAVETGQEYVSHLCRGFKEIYGTTPDRYRKRHGYHADSR